MQQKYLWTKIINSHLIDRYWSLFLRTLLSSSSGHMLYKNTISHFIAIHISVQTRLNLWDAFTTERGCCAVFTKYGNHNIKQVRKYTHSVILAHSPQYDLILHSIYHDWIFLNWTHVNRTLLYSASLTNVPTNFGQLLLNHPEHNFKKIRT